MVRLKGPNPVPSTKHPSLEQTLRKKGFKEIDDFPSLCSPNPVSIYDLPPLISKLIYEANERRVMITDFAILPNREATEDKSGSRGYYNIYVLPKK